MVLSDTSFRNWIKPPVAAIKSRIAVVWTEFFDRELFTPQIFAAVAEHCPFHGHPWRRTMGSTVEIESKVVRDLILLRFSEANQILLTVGL